MFMSLFLPDPLGAQHRREEFSKIHESLHLFSLRSSEFFPIVLLKFIQIRWYFKLNENVLKHGLISLKRHTGIVNLLLIRYQSDT